ncbi:MAG: hypothetical protein ACRDSR_25890, partial [Pseudonocardiaceae bacterium]
MPPSRCRQRVLPRCRCRPRQGRRKAAGRYRVPPPLAARDGIDGWPEHAPYDRIIATCSVRHIPWAWAQQLTVGGNDGPCVFRTAFLVVISGCVLPVQVLVADLAWGLVVKSRMETLS